VRFLKDNLAASYYTEIVVVLVAVVIVGYAAWKLFGTQLSEMIGGILGQIR
jgi:Flp pilus assembly pilin Flp